MKILSKKLGRAGAVAVVLLAICFCLVLFIPKEKTTASAATYTDFVAYTNDDRTNLHMDATYPQNITTAAEANAFSIVLEVISAKTWDNGFGFYGPNIKSLTITLSLNGQTKATYSVPAQNKVSSGKWTLFTAKDIKDDNGNFALGTYTVQASGSLDGSYWGSGQSVNSSFTFSVNDVTPPIVNVPTSVVKSATVTAEDSAELPSGITSLKYGRSVSDRYPTATTDFSSGHTFTEDGFYTVTAKDGVGNSTTKHFTIDQTPPALSRSCGEYTNKAFYVSYTDLIATQIIVTKPNGSTQTVNGTRYDVADNESNYGAWSFSVTDAGGNSSSTSVKFFKRATFGNQAVIRDRYKIPAWWQVRLPAGIFDDETMGTYSFGSRSEAVAFAEAKERAARVTTLDDSKWSYVTAGNETVSQIYTDPDELARVIGQYAARYVSDRQVVGQNGNLPPRPTDGNGTHDAALNSQTVPLPSHLNAYASYTRYFARRDVSFARPGAGVAGNSTQVRVKQISDCVSAVNGTEVNVGYGVTLEDAYFIQNTNGETVRQLVQGYYLVTETDLCGNVEKYIVVIDTDTPTLRAVAAFGDGRKETIDYSYSYVTEHAGVMSYVSFAPENLFDSLDEHVVLHISGRNLDEYYIKTDAMPVLCYENETYGRYEIELYDRSGNTFSFSITVAGAPPYVSHTSLRNTTKCTFTVELGTGNALTAISMYKVSYEGTYTPMTTDDDGTAVTTATSQYVVRFGGKYVLRFTDVFGRKVETDPIFYLKGLPTGTLKGVKEGEVTNGDVQLIYAENCTAELYEKSGDGWVKADLLVFGALRNEVTATLPANAVSGEHSYKFLLFVTTERNLFVEYAFKVRRITPTVHVVTKSGLPVTYGDFIAEPFRLTWTGNYTVSYVKVGATLATPASYRKGDYIDGSGTWEFTVVDDVKNSLTFNVSIDNTVDYTIDGQYTVLDGVLASRTWVSVTLEEAVRTFRVTSSCGVTVSSGDRLSQDGTYAFYIEDYVGNVAEFTVLIDQTPPEITAETTDGNAIVLGGFTNKNFILKTNETDVGISYQIGGVYRVYNGEILDLDGKYFFEAVDILGNKTEFTITKKSSLRFSVNGKYVILPDGTYLTNTWISVDALETLVRFEVVSSCGATVSAGERMTLEGEYTVTVEDAAGNIETLKIVVDKTPPEVTLRTVGGKIFEQNAVINEGFSVLVADDDVRITYATSSAKNLVYYGEPVSKEGVYTFRVTDLAGNTIEFTVTVDKTVEYTVSGYTALENGVYISNAAVTVTSKERITRFTVTGGNVKYGLGDGIAAEGEYTVAIEDVAGNVATLKIVIDKTPPRIELEGVVEGGTSGLPVAATLYDGVRLQQTDNAGNVIRDLADGGVLSDHGNYILRAVDVAGNVATVRFSIDRRVDVTVSGVAIAGQITTEPVAFSFGEKLTAIASRDGESFPFKGGRIAAPGSYEVLLSDAFGNVVGFTFTILPARARSYDFRTNGFDVEVFCDGMPVNDVFDGENVCLEVNGTYTVAFTRDLSRFEAVLTVFNTPPEVVITHNGKTVTVVSTEKYSYVLTRDGKEVSFTLGETIKTNGKYVLTVTDDLGNENVYTFTVKRLNGAGVAVIVLALVLVAAVVLTVVLARRKSGIR